MNGINDINVLNKKLNLKAENSIKDKNTREKFERMVPNKVDLFQNKLQDRKLKQIGNLHPRIKERTGRTTSFYMNNELSQNLERLKYAYERQGLYYTFSHAINNLIKDYLERIGYTK